MSKSHWFEKFRELAQGDTVDFGGFRLKVWGIMSEGGCQFTKSHGGEIIPRHSSLWEIAVIEGKDVYWVDSSRDDAEDNNEPADWWKE